jgi:pSer/pThr/pTyr-binding forkhead associated (FHA) protein
MAKIIVTFNGLVQQEVSINKSRITIGRRIGNDIVIDHLTVSGQHAAIDTTSNGSFVLDLGSTNGTLVNNQPVKSIYSSTTMSLISASTNYAFR